MSESNPRIVVLATPNASRTKVGGSHDGALKVRVVAVPEKGRANQAILNALAKALGVRKSQIKLVGGDSNRRKTFEVSDPPAGFMPVLERLLNE